MAATEIGRDAAIDSLRAWVDQGAKNSETMPAEWYVSPEIFELEKRHLLAETWHIVGLADKVANPGDYFTVTLLDEPVVVVRDKKGEVHALANVCRHRGAPVALGEGNSRVGFACLYHGWSYNLDGSGRRCAGMEDAENFDPKALQLPKYRVAIWSKWVFVSMSEDAPPFDEWIETVADRSQQYRMDELEFMGARRYELDVNWKMINDANHEAYHVPFVHPGLTTAYGVAGNFGVGDGDKLADAEEATNGNENTTESNGYTHMTKPYGGEIFALEPNPRGPFSKVISSLGGTADYRQIKPPLEWLEGRERISHYFLFNWPGLSHFHFMPDGLGLILLIPVSVNKTIMRVEWWMPPAKRFDEKLLQAALIVFGNQILDEDGAVTLVTKRGLQSRSYDRGRLAPTQEGLLYAYDQWYIQQMQAALEKEGL
ncbi:MAG TPA: aromatic ring-hydroxylating dioxygenase subunit alpha [Baekduia sp.]|nr:aromatic ring-hydroxylating dioxygenase subunit alpha [Baekduia sp.]